jgi:fucokinase
MARARTAPPQPGFDVLVLTVANRVQQRYAERMLEIRRQLGALPAGLRTIVVADPAGKRIGSGGSTLLCLDLLRREGLLRGQRVLILHSGGDSRRLPAWSPFGKIWVPLGREGRGLGPMNVPALFDLVLAELETLVLPASGGVLVASGDAALRLTGERVAFDARAATVLAFPGDAARAARHGVFVTGRDGRVRRTLQKAARAELRAAGALDARGLAAIDSGIFHFPPAACSALLRGARAMLPGFRRGAASLDLYQEVADVMAADTTPAGYVARFGSADAARTRTLRTFFAAAHRVPLRVAMLSAGSFLHLGSTRELIERLASREPERMFPDRLGPARTDLKPHEPRITRDPGMPRGCCVSAVHVRGGTCTTAHGIDDDCKTDAAHGGTFCGRPLADLPARTGMDARAIWGPNPHTLWYARIHPVAADGHWHHVGWMMDGSDAPAGWKRGRKLSFADLMLRADAERSAREDYANHHLPRRARGPLERARAFAGSEAVATTAAARARARSSALAAIGDAVSTDIPLPPVAQRFAVRPDQAVWASAPVRIDLAGGWSDTPPLCIEHGGSVVNAALTLGGTLPLQAMVRVTDDPVITLHSVDAGRTARYTGVRQLLDHHDPSQWDALPRAALVLSGLVPRDPKANLRTHLVRAGGGLAITLFSAVPRGSGLGTSSILGATLLATLDRVAGHATDPSHVARGASLLEQMIRTRGGWQDQVGGLWGGFKLCTTRPGTHQVPQVAPLAPPPAFLHALGERAILLYSGRRRMARGILETVVLRYLRGEPAVLDARRRLVAGAHLMADAVRAGDLDEFALRLNEYRDLKRTVDPASVTPDLEAPMHALDRHLDAWSFAGAGGGGFLILLCRSARAAQDVRRRLHREPPHPLARPFDFQIDPAGLRIAVL